MDRRTCACLPLCVLALLLLAPVGHCSLTVEMDARRLAAEADTIVIGMVVGIRPGAGFHQVDVRVEVPLKHSRTGEILTLTIPGGPDPRGPDFVPAVPHFAPGETSLIHVEQVAPGRFTVLGGVQGRKAICNGLLVGDYEPLSEAVQTIEGVCGRHPEAGGAARFNTRAAPATAMPAIASISPSKAAANIGDTVVISGQNFGPGPGPTRYDSVLFSRADYPGAVATADIVSWSDGSITCKVPMADSGGVVVEVDGVGASDPKPFDVSFCYSGEHVPNSAFPQRRSYHKDGTPDTVGENGALDRAFATWAKHGYMHSYLWSTEADGYPHPHNQFSIVAWCPDGGWPYLYPPESTAPGVLVVQSRHSRGMWLNDAAGFNWTLGASGYDVQNVATHLVGHWWGLADLFGSRDRAKTMYHLVKADQTKNRSLTDDDIAGITRLYPGKPVLGTNRVRYVFTDVAGGQRIADGPMAKGVNKGSGFLSWRITRSEPDWLTARGSGTSYAHEGNQASPDILLVARTENLTVLGSPYRGTFRLVGPPYCGTRVLDVPVTLKITGDAPYLRYASYFPNGVKPSSAKPGENFTFNVAYKCPDDYEPKRAACRVERYTREHLWEFYGELKMTKNWGAVDDEWMCWGAATLPENAYRIRFIAVTPDGHKVGGAPTKWRRYPRIIAPPRLRWTGATGYTSDGVQPNVGPAGTRFYFKVDYWDAAGDAPSRAQVQLRQDGRIVFTKGMAAAVNTPCWQGRIYRTSILINRRGQYEYRFRFADATGAARGAPTRWKSGLRVTESSQGMPAITSLVATPTNAGAQLTFDLGAQADVTARVLNLAGRPIRTICRAKALEAGTRTLVWNAQDDSGLPVPRAVYLLEVSADGADGARGRALTPVRIERE